MKGVEFKLNLKDGKGLVKSDKETSTVLGTRDTIFKKKKSWTLPSRSLQPDGEDRCQTNNHTNKQ